MEQSNVVIRLANIEDADQINSLLQRNLPQYIRDRAFWMWIHRMLNEKPSIISIATIGEKVVGHYAIIPQEVIVNNKIVQAGLGVHALVDKDYSNVSIIEIAQKAYNEAKARGFCFLYGFPNQNYRLIQERIERWNKVSLFNAYELAISSDKIEQFFCLEVDEALDDFDTLFKMQHLIEMSEAVDYIRVNKNIYYYYFRYMKHPQNLYKTAFLKSGDEILGCLFTKEYTNENNIKRLHLVDFIISPKLYISDIIAYLRCYGHNQGIDFISLWPVNSNFEQVLLENGFEARGFDTFFGIKILDTSLDKNILLTFENWQLMMGESDAF